jgi:DNA-binding CsgD family transcriptional regulator
MAIVRPGDWARRRGGWEMAREGTAVGRTDELGALTAHLDEPRGRPISLLVSGPPGIGKSTLIAHAVEHAERSGHRVVAIRCRAVERHLAWCALSDIIERFGVADELPVAQRRALDLVRLRWGAGGRRVDARLVGAAFTGVLRHELLQGPVVVVIDDVHWLDGESLGALAFARRRLDGDLIVVLAGRSTALTDVRASTLIDGDHCELALGPLESHELAEVLALHGFGCPTDWRTVQDLAAGNPLYAITLARHFEFGAGNDGLPAGLTEAVAQLIVGLEPSTFDALAILAALGSRSLPQLAAVGRRLGTVGTVDAIVEALEPAEDRGLVTLERGAARFSHPLFPAVVLDALAPSHRRHLHVACALVLDDPVESVHHRALASVGVDPVLGDEIDAAVSLLSARGAHRTAAELARQGLAHTDPADVDRRIERTLRRAEELIAAGAHRQALRALDDMGDADSGCVDFGHGTLARASMVRAAAVLDDPVVAADLYEVAAAESDLAGRTDLGSTAHLRLAALSAFEPAKCLAHAEAAAERTMRAIGDPGGRAALAEAWRRWSELQVAGRTAASDLPAFEPVGADDDPATQYLPAWWALGNDRIEIAERRIAHACERSHRDGRDEAGAMLRAVAAEIAGAAGRWSDACDHATQAVRLSQLAGVSSVGAWASGILGLARAHTAGTAPTHEPAMSAASSAFSLLAQGVHLLHAGESERALATLSDLEEQLDVLGMREPIRIRYEGDLLDAAVAAHDLERASQLVERLDARHRCQPRHYTAALAERGRALIAAANGDLDDAVDVAHRALTAHRRLGAPGETARMHMVIGTIHRRLRHWHLATDHLGIAVETFWSLGAVRLAEHAKVELDRIGERGARSSDELTAAERRIAELAARGLTNTEVAAAAFVSVKTVESTLTRVYRKLGIRRRVELSSRM